MRYNLLICGVGDQEILTLSEILGQAAIAEGLKAIVTVDRGLPQRGGYRRGCRYDPARFGIGERVSPEQERGSGFAGRAATVRTQESARPGCRLRLRAAGTSGRREPLSFPDGLRGRREQPSRMIGLCCCFSVFRPPGLTGVRFPTILVANTCRCSCGRGRHNSTSYKEV